MNLTQTQPTPELRQIESAVASAKILDRDIFLAVRFDNASYEELADQHGISVEEVEKAVARMMVRILRVGRPRWWQFWH